VQLGEKQDVVSARDKLSHYRAEMIATKAEGKNYDKNGHTSLFNNCHGLRDV
jgi:hypothetical protein